MRREALYPGHADPRGDVLELLAQSVSPEQILADYPDLEPEDIQASLLFAAQRANHARLVA